MEQRQEARDKNIEYRISLRRFELLHVPHQETILPLNQRLKKGGLKLLKMIVKRVNVTQASKCVNRGQLYSLSKILGNRKAIKSLSNQRSGRGEEVKA
jgi:hypothetical protein